mmetsp:Transcript_12988/g.24084  ORF Transcript_12988/g.24084 Transcript_12988/m.24084 type:complete len:82 (+) Transcript_12988:194-439(+)|eukprot:CAMPEP_0171613572 /NCGR_PEP_ID=MMETSP0990-20121206/11843_1 /TAXON_ID=483369 /ORGANISM="non described non described, Strain CCMP2098" /LENGTH=81 /DNA_ID=CAMNT_0012177435 /DNA_START=175 /DNA_END=420 /DNA_ORIENTATION=+
MPLFLMAVYRQLIRWWVLAELQRDLGVQNSGDGSKSEQPSGRREGDDDAGKRFLLVLRRLRVHTEIRSWMVHPDGESNADI